MTNHEVEALCVRLKSGEYDGGNIMQAWIMLRQQADEIERLTAALHDIAYWAQSTVDGRRPDPELNALGNANRIASDIVEMAKEAFSGSYRSRTTAADRVADEPKPSLLTELKPGSVCLTCGRGWIPMPGGTLYHECVIGGHTVKSSGGL